MKHVYTCVYIIHVHINVYNVYVYAVTSHVLYIHVHVHACMYVYMYVYTCACVRVLELLVKDLNLLEGHSLISMDDGFLLQPTGTLVLYIRHVYTCTCTVLRIYNMHAHLKFGRTVCVAVIL